MNTNVSLQTQSSPRTNISGPVMYAPNSTISNPSIPPTHHHQQQQQQQQNIEFSSLPSLNSIPSNASANDLMAPLSSSSASSTIEKTLSFPSFGSNDQLNETLTDISRSSLNSETRKSSNDEASAATTAAIVQLARRRRSSKSKEKQQQQRKNSALTRPQGRPLSKETKIRLTLVPTLGILYSILVSDTMRKTLKILKYSNEDHSLTNTNEELSTGNVISGFSSLLNVKTARFSEDGLNYSPDEKQSTTPKFNSIDEAVFSLFGLNDYTLIRVSRAAATEVGGSVLLKIETAMPGYLYLNDDEDEDFKTVEENQEMYHEAIGSKGDRPSTTFLKKKVARPRYKSDMRIYLIPRINSCAIYCEKRMFKRDLLRGFLNMNNLDRSIIVAFDHEEVIDELERESHGDLIKKMNLPTVEEFRNSTKAATNSYPIQPAELSVSKQSTLQHLQHLQSHHHHHPGAHIHIPTQQSQHLQQGQNQTQNPYYTGFNFPRQGPNELSLYDASSQPLPPSSSSSQQQPPPPQLTYGFPQHSSPQMYHMPGQEHSYVSQSLQAPLPPPPPQQHPQQPQQLPSLPLSQIQAMQTNTFSPPSYNGYPYPPEVDPSSQANLVPMDQQFIQAQQPMGELMGGNVHDPNRSRSLNQSQQSGRFYNPQQPFQQPSQMFPRQVMNPYMTGPPPQGHLPQQYNNNEQPNHPQDVNGPFYYQ